MASAAPKILGVGKRAENAEAMQQMLREAGYEAHNFAVADDPAGDALIVRELREGGYAAIVIGSFINGQHPELPATAQTSAWFERVLNLVHEHGPGVRIVLVRKPSEVVSAVGRVLHA